MKLINMNINEYVHMVPLWKSPIKLPVEASPLELPEERAADASCSSTGSSRGHQGLPVLGKPRKTCILIDF